MSDYSKLKNAELEALLKERGLPHSGKKAEMVARLQENDKASQPAAPAPAAAAANEDEIDWDDDAAPAEAAPPAAAATESTGEGNNPAAVPNQVPAIDPSTTEDLAVNPPAETTADAPATDSEEKSAEAPAPAVEEKDYSMGLGNTDVEAEIAKRKARAEKFGIKEGEEDPDALEAIKKLERAKKFNDTDTTISKLDGALPDQREKRRRVDGDDRGDYKRRGGRGGGGRNFGGRRGGDRGPRRDGRDERNGGGASWMSAEDRRRAEARNGRF